MFEKAPDPELFLPIISGSGAFYSKYLRIRRYLVFNNLLLLIGDRKKWNEQKQITLMDQVVCSLALCPIKNWNWAFLNQENANYLCIQIAPDPELFTPIISGSGDMRERKWLSRTKKFVKMLFKIFLKVLSKICSAKNVSLWVFYKHRKSHITHSFSFLWKIYKQQKMQQSCKFAAGYSIFAKTLIKWLSGSENPDAFIRV